MGSSPKKRPSAGAYGRTRLLWSPTSLSHSLAVYLEGFIGRGPSGATRAPYRTWPKLSPWVRAASAWHNLAMTCSGVCRLDIDRLLRPSGRSETLIAHGPVLGS